MGAFTNEGLYWLSPKGNVYTVNSLSKPNKSMSHEEYANKKWKISLEETLDKGFIRIQAIAPQYLFIQHTQPKVKATQDASLWGFFSKNNEVIPYNRVIIERPGNELNWSKGKNLKASQDYIRAYEFTKTGELPEEVGDEESQINYTLKGKPGWLFHQNRMRDVSMVDPFYQNKTNPIGDSVISFKVWLNECINKQNTGLIPKEPYI